MVPESEKMTPLSQEKQGRRKKTPPASHSSPAAPIYYASIFKLKQEKRFELLSNVSGTLMAELNGYSMSGDTSMGGTTKGDRDRVCNQHISLLKKNEQDDEVLDFFKYHTWTPDKLNMLCEHNSQASATASFHRGQKVTGWGEGSMTGWGVWLPTGGASGDGYDIYKGMAISKQASVEEGIDLFQDHAEIGIHSEGDAGHGLCCQLEWFGKKE
ncbi:hypothetical protein K435DRAFT_799940 [Dendrothele bispora CBS 962.96]|uniref:Uncharacterized protein n=1 Tax=Dendrothele bispora (strain CBS 962.96) TaxID=1314807 RepID=A0A4S8LU91_DENBC|nr:hypothetical protein K435DRAFT_799940 [Dendrothele bispora CBS 962.96]